MRITIHGETWATVEELKRLVCWLLRIDPNNVTVDEA